MEKNPITGQVYRPSYNSNLPVDDVIRTASDRKLQRKALSIQQTKKSRNEQLRKIINTFLTERRFFIVCYIPVSYTHLDVYKRQIQTVRLVFIRKLHMALCDLHKSAIASIFKVHTLCVLGRARLIYQKFSSGTKKFKTL